MEQTNFKHMRADFEKWLVGHLNYSNKTAKDYASRCNRIEINITQNILKAVSNADEFAKLASKIQEYAANNTSNKESAYVLAGSLRAAAKKYAMYQFPEKTLNYPTAHGKSKYS